MTVRMKTAIAWSVTAQCCSAAQGPATLRIEDKEEGSRRRGGERQKSADPGPETQNIIEKNSLKKSWVELSEGIQTLKETARGKCDRKP